MAGRGGQPQREGLGGPRKGYGEKVTALLEQILRTEDPSSPAAGTPEPAWAKLVAGYPQYQKDGLEALAEAGILDSPETWAGRFGRDMTVGEAVGIMGKLLAWMRTAGENPAG